ncbi:Oxygen-dependent choline dehydrogenase [Hypsizygus marmoreus]|uniref:Oxygen-dependent choline dehydrogenase n=1 Tax=Hypsizygus marmoreus TaxID=39966 RepID=A0A369K5T2_HYPMA|nr:Oxygen-dependent choline dehydrogenase [Hypsizygus marmoreus]
MSPLLHRWFLFPILAVLVTTTYAALDICPNSTDADYDFIVVGAGAGGGPLASRLAENGFSVLLIDSGHDVANVNTTVPAYNLRSIEDPQIELNYTIQEYPDGFPVQRDDSWYPRARALGGSTIHNAMINIIAGTRKDFNDLAGIFNDPTWSRDNMQNYFRRIEHNLYLLPLLAPDHGFDGWLKTSVLPLDVFLNNPGFLDLQVVDIVAALALADLPILDLNTRASDGAAGVISPSSTIDENHLRSSVRERLLNVRKSSSGRLSFSLDTLATKVLLCDSGGGAPSAYGVQIAPGVGLPVANNFGGKVDLDVRNVTARHEVIVSAGAFQSPQLVSDLAMNKRDYLLSGIGDQEHLREHGIDTVTYLPGAPPVFTDSRRADHDEVSVIWRMKQNYSLLNECKFLSDPNKDPCLKYWQQHNHENVYAFGSALDAIITKSSASLDVPDILTYFTPVSFPGFFRGAPQQVADVHNALTAVVLKAHPSSKGTVRLTGSHPQDRLDIQKLRFQAPGGPADIAALRNGIKRARGIVELSPISLLVDAEVSPGSNALSDDEIDQYILERAFGHHVCCTNAIGPASDPNAVLDGDFKVRGVDRLRVVDASSWPNVPGFFITTPTYMMSEKAADVIVAAAKNRK